MVYRKKNISKNNGFALLMTLLVVSVVISIGLSILDLSTKQIRLSTNARDSEIAFHAASAGLECARYQRRIASSTMETGGSISVTCFGSTVADSSQSITAGVSGDGDVFKYDYEFTWGSGQNQRCSQITTLISSADVTGSGLEIANMNTIVPGYPDAESNCEAGERCTILSVRGYNRPCSLVGSEGTLQREVLLQF